MQMRRIQLQHENSRKLVVFSIMIALVVHLATASAVSSVRSPCTKNGNQINNCGGEVQSTPCADHASFNGTSCICDKGFIDDIDANDPYNIQRCRQADLTTLEEEETDTDLTLTISSWSDCFDVQVPSTSPCQLSKRFRSVECIKTNSGLTLSWIGLCLIALDLPIGTYFATEETCVPSSCIIASSSPSWEFPASLLATPWTECSAECGVDVGIRYRAAAQCVETTDSVSAIVVDSMCNTDLQPAHEEPCNQFVCPTPIESLDNNWTSSCLPVCGVSDQPASSMQVASSVCVDSNSNFVLPATKCGNAFVQIVSNQCTQNFDCTTPTTPTWAMSEWTACSSLCGGGVRTRTVYCAGESDSTLCESQAGPKPLTSEACGTESCELFSWMLQIDAECTARCRQPVDGSRYSTLSCVSSLGHFVSTALCAAALVGLPQPIPYLCPDTCDSNRRLHAHVMEPSEALKLDVIGFSKNLNSSSSSISAAPSIRRIARRKAYVANNNVIEPEQSETSMHRKLATKSTCGTDTPMKIDSTCCLAGQQLDRDGECCAVDKLDACKQCQGTAIAIDALGRCCPTGSAFDARGWCCKSGVVDRCGVCDGGGLSCGARVSAQVVTVGVAPTLDNKNAAALISTYLSEVVSADSFSVSVTGSDPSLVLTVSPLSSVSERWILALALIQDTSVVVDSTRQVVVGNWVAVSVCGNGVCESGETCPHGEECCISDCPFILNHCPIDENSRECGGYGWCDTLSGQCSCFPGLGRSGLTCQACATEYELEATGEYCVQTSALQLGIQCSNSQQDGQETGVDCGGPDCPTPCAAAFWELVPWWGWVVVSFGVPVIWLVLVLTFSQALKVTYICRNRCCRRGGGNDSDKPSRSNKSRFWSTRRRQNVEGSAQAVYVDPRDGSSRNRKGKEIEMTGVEKSRSRISWKFRRNSRADDTMRAETLTNYIPGESVVAKSRRSQREHNDNHEHGISEGSDDETNQSSGLRAFLVRALERETAIEGWTLLKCTTRKLIIANKSEHKRRKHGVDTQYTDRYCVLDTYQCEIRHYGNMLPSRFGNVYVELQGQLPLNLLVRVERSTIDGSKSKGKKLTLFFRKHTSTIATMETRMKLKRYRDASRWYHVLSHYVRQNALVNLRRADDRPGHGGVEDPRASLRRTQSNGAHDLPKGRRASTDSGAAGMSASGQRQRPEALDVTDSDSLHHDDEEVEEYVPAARTVPHRQSYTHAAFFGGSSTPVKNFPNTDNTGNDNVGDQVDTSPPLPPPLPPNWVDGLESFENDSRPGSTKGSRMTSRPSLPQTYAPAVPVDNAALPFSSRRPSRIESFSWMDQRDEAEAEMKRVSSQVDLSLMELEGSEPDLPLPGLPSRNSSPAPQETQRRQSVSRAYRPPRSMPPGRRTLPPTNQTLLRKSQQYDSATMVMLRRQQQSKQRASSEPNGPRRVHPKITGRASSASTRSSARERMLQVNDTSVGRGVRKQQQYDQVSSGAHVNPRRAMRSFPSIDTSSETHSLTRDLVDSLGRMDSSSSSHASSASPMPTSSTVADPVAAIWGNFEQQLEDVEAGSFRDGRYRNDEIESQVSMSDVPLPPAPPPPPPPPQ